MLSGSAAAVRAKSRRPMSGPTGPKPPEPVEPKSQGRTVYLPKEFWEELTEVADFHEHVFGVLGAKAAVSRNDMIEAFLRWALDAYWEDLGGKPGSSKDRDAKAAKKAETIRQVQKQQSKK